MTAPIIRLTQGAPTLVLSPLVNATLGEHYVGLRFISGDYVGFPSANIQELIRVLEFARDQLLDEQVAKAKGVVL